ncbi:MAG: glycosyltransferase family 4 protein [Anaerolineales bacterium]
MHILLIHQAFVTIGEAGGTRHHELARELVRRGHRVTVLAGGVSYLTGKQVGSGWLTRQQDDVGVRIWRPYTYSGWHRSFVHRVVSFVSFMLSSFIVGLRVREVDLIWGTSPPIFQAASSWLLARLKRVPYVLEIRDLWPYFAIEVGVLRNRWLIAMSRWLERFLYRRADRLVVNSPGFIDHVHQRGAKRVDLVPNGVDISMFDPAASGQSFRQANGLGDGYVVLYAGAHGMSNDLGVVLQAAELLRDEPAVVFALVGDGKEKPALQARVLELALNNVRFVPAVEKSGMRQALAAADACLAILKPLEAYRTTYPNKVFDYMAAGRPVLLAIDGVIRQVVEQAQAGLFVPPGDPGALADAIRQLRSDPEGAREMGLRGRRYVGERFSRTTSADKLLKVFESALSDRVGDQQR